MGDEVVAGVVGILFFFPRLLVDSVEGTAAKMTVECDRVGWSSGSVGCMG